MFYVLGNLKFEEEEDTRFDMLQCSFILFIEHKKYYFKHCKGVLMLSILKYVSLTFHPHDWSGFKKVKSMRSESFNLLPPVGQCSFMKGAAGLNMLPTQWMMASTILVTIAQVNNMGLQEARN